MTLPDERYRALKMNEQFLLDLCIPSSTPKVPSYIRDRARSVLRHFPTKYEIEQIAEALPNLFKNGEKDESRN